MDFRAKLAFLEKAPARGEESGAAVGGERSRATEDRGLRSPSSPVGANGTTHSSLPLHHRHGNTALGAALEIPGSAIARLALDPSLASLDVRDLLFLDTETTGLAGGAGTLPFLIGLAWFEGD